MSRNLLHKSRLQPFKMWLEQRGIEHRPGRGNGYQVLQVKQGSAWCGIYQRDHMPEHLTVERRLERLVREFIRENKEDGKETEARHSTAQERDSGVQALARSQRLQDPPWDD